MQECITVDGKGDEIRCNDCENEGILVDRGSRVEIPIIRNAARSTVGTPISSFNQSRSFVPDLHAASNLSLILIGIGSPASSKTPWMPTSSKMIPYCSASYHGHQESKKGENMGFGKENLETVWSCSIAFACPSSLE